MRAGLTQGSAQGSAVVTNELSFGFLAALADVFVEGAVFLTKFVCDLFLLGHQLIVVHHRLLLSSGYLLDVGIDDEIDGPA